MIVLTNARDDALKELLESGSLGAVEFHRKHECMPTALVELIKKKLGS